MSVIREKTINSFGVSKHLTASVCVCEHVHTHVRINIHIHLQSAASESKINGLFHSSSWHYEWILLSHVQQHIKNKQVNGGR